MSDIHYLVGDVANPPVRPNITDRAPDVEATACLVLQGGDGLLPYILVQLVNDAGRYGAGVSGAIARRWPKVERSYRTWYQRGPGFRLGGMLLVHVEPDIWVANVVGQRSVKGDPALEGEAPIRYEAIADGLGKVREVALIKECPVVMPRIGCGLAGGTWGRVEPIVWEQLTSRDVEVFVIDPARMS